MTFSPTHAYLEAPFEVESVARIAAPAGHIGDWWLYVLCQGSNRSSAITGQRGGSRLELDAHVAVLLEQLNQRLTKPTEK